MGQDCLPVASMRHFIDATILQNQGRFGDAVCHYAFSAECWIKIMLAHYMQTTFRGHSFMENALVNLRDYFDIAGFSTPELYSVINFTLPPEVLFNGHPGRRYWADIPYTDSQVEDCRIFAENLMNNLALAVLDGKIIW